VEKIRRADQRWGAVICWLPIILLVALGIAAANGISMQPTALADTDRDNSTVTAEVVAEIHLDFNGVNGCHSTGDANGTLNFNNTHGAITAGSGILELGCDLIFGTNTGLSGAVLDIKSDATGAPFFASCPIGTRPACVTTGGQFPDVGANGANLAPDGSGRGLFGLKAESVSSSGVAIQGNWTGDDWNPIATTASNICIQSVVNTDGVCGLRFALDADFGNNPGTYTGQATLTATAA
jgi:hypothetical protein